MGVRRPRLRLGAWGSILGAVATVAAAGPIDGPSRLAPDPAVYVAPSRTFATEHIALDLDVDLVAKSIAGSVTHRMRALAEPLEEIRLNAVGLTIEAVAIDGRPVEFAHPVESSRVTSWIEDLAAASTGDLLVITPQTPIPRGQVFTVQVRYHGAPGKGLYFIEPEKGLDHKRPEVWSQGEGEDNRYWIPLHDYPDEKATYEGRFRVGKGEYALSNGVLVDRRQIGDKTEFHWRLDQPQASYLIMLAAAQYDVHELAHPRVPLTVLVAPGTSQDKVERGYGITADVLDFFEQEIGLPYPYGKYAQVVVQNFIWGGMENTTATVMTSRSLFDAGLGLTRDNHGLVAHELAHQWWGDMVTCREWSHLWLNEGFATYYTHLYNRHERGEDAFQYGLMTTHRSVVAADHKDPRPMVVDFFNRQDARNSANVYSKGSSVLHMLRNQLGDPLYREVVRRYGEDRRFQLADTADLARVVREVSGQNLDWFFEQWAYLAGHPMFEVTKQWDSSARTLRVKIAQTQDAGHLWPIFRVPVELELTAADGTRKIHRLQLDAASQEFHFQLEAAPDLVVFDPDGWILKEVKFDKPAGELIRQLRRGRFLARVRAAEALGEVAATAEVVSALAEAVASDADWGLRREATLALGRLGSDAARTALLDACRSDSARVRLAATEALAKVERSDAVIARLEALLDDDPAWEVRAKALASLVDLRGSDAAATCRNALSQVHERFMVRVAALEGLAKLRDTTAIDKVERLARPGNDREYRHKAIEVYGTLVSKQDDAAKAKGARFLAGMLDDWFLRTRGAVITALGELGPESRAHLERAVRNDPVDDLRQAARTQLAKLDAPKGGDELKESVTALTDKVERLERELRRLRELRPVDGHDAP